MEALRKPSQSNCASGGEICPSCPSMPVSCRSGSRSRLHGIAEPLESFDGMSVQRTDRILPPPEPRSPTGALLRRSPRSLKKVRLRGKAPLFLLADCRSPCAAGVRQAIGSICDSGCAGLAHRRSHRLILSRALETVSATTRAASSGFSCSQTRTTVQPASRSRVLVCSSRHWFPAIFSAQYSVFVRGTR